jgi:hypothetical protein
MATHPSRTTIDSEIAHFKGDLFADALPRSAQSVPPPADDPPRRPRAQALRMQRRAFGRQGTLAALGAALAVVAGYGAALHFAAITKVAAPEQAVILPVVPELAVLETPEREVAAVVPAGTAPPKEAHPRAPATLKSASETAPKAAPSLPSLPSRDEVSAHAGGDAGRDINTAAASSALSLAASRAKSCLDADDPRTTMEVRVTFAPSGRVTTAMVSRGPFAGTEIGGCIARALRTAKVGPFEGPPVTVSRSIRIR